MTEDRTIALHSGRIEIDGRPELLLSGEVHYFRLPRTEWEPRIRAVREAGLDTLASYIPWLWHELPDGRIDLDGSTAAERDLVGFLDLCAEHGLRFLARPGPFVMAELKNEGLPYSVARRHPGAVPVGWDSRPATTDDLDYLHPGYQQEVDRWLDAVYPLLAERQHHRGGPVVGVQLDNEVGMLAWVSNTPQLTEAAVGQLWDSIRQRYGADRAADLVGVPTGTDLPALLEAVRSAGADTLAVHQEIGLLARDRFDRYLCWLRDRAREHGLTVPLLINVHGTGQGRGHTYPIGVSQLGQAYRGRPGVIAGSDYYLGELTVQNAADLYLCNAIMNAVNGPDQPASALEFEAGTGDYGDDLGALNSPESSVNKTLLTLAQGNRLINYYLFAGGRNPALSVEGVADGIDRIAFTGEQHGFAAPIGPTGMTTAVYRALTTMISELRRHAEVLSSGRQLTDELGFGFVADHYLTEYAHPARAQRTEQVAELERHRGFGFRDCLGRALVLGGYSFGAVDLQAAADPGSAWAAGGEPPELPPVLALSSGRTLAEPVQRLLVRHLRSGGRLLLTGLLPDRDHDGSRCTLLAEALGLTAAGIRTDSRDADGPYWPTVAGEGPLAETVDVRAGSTQLVEFAAGTVLLRETGSGLPCAVEGAVGDGVAIFLGCDYPAAHLDTWRELLGRLSLIGRVQIDADRPGLLALPVGSDRGRLLIMINLAPYPIEAAISVDGQPVIDRRQHPARGHAIIEW